jgi:hypothetical protein
MLFFNCNFQLDFDSDGVLSREDLQELVIRLTGSENLKENEMYKLIDNLISEADLDNDGFLSFNEFEHIVMKSSADFLRYRILFIFFFSKSFSKLDNIQRKVNHYF